MSWLKDLADFADALFRGTLWRKRHAHYYNPLTCYRFAKKQITVFIPSGDFKDLSPAWKELSSVLSECGVSSTVTTDTNLRPVADVVLFVDPTLPTGGHTHTDHDPANHSILIRAIIRIAATETGKDRRKTATHETTHCYTTDHSTDDRDASHSPCFVTGYSGADKATVRKVYGK